MASIIKPGSVVWAKCGSNFWPAEVLDFQNLPDDIREDFANGKEPAYTVKFFDEDGYEFMKDDKKMFPYNCERKEEFIKKGIVKSRGKAKEGATGGWFAKFPKDVIRSEKLTGGDLQILEKDPYVEKPVEKINYKELFGDPKEKEKLAAKASKRKSAGGASSPAIGSPKKKANKSKSPPREISHPRFKPGGEQHQVRIMQQPSTPYHLDLQKKEEDKTNNPQASDGLKCNFCSFTTTRMNVLIMHTKSHSEPAKSALPASAARSSPTASKSPATPSSRGRGRGRGRGSSTATPSRATPTTKVSSTDTPKSARGRGAGTTPKSARGRGAGRGRPPKEKPSVEASTTVTPVKEKKPRVSKKKKEQLEKEEKEKKIEERKKILGEWDEEEDNEAEVEEKKKVKETLGEDSDQSDMESDQEAYFQDDNINNYHEDDSDEELFQDDNNVSKIIENLEKEEEEEDLEKEKENENGKDEEVVEPEPEKNTNGTSTEPSIDVAKLLEETKVPDLPDLDTLSAGPKKSVSFSAQVAKEFAITKMALVQPKSNMAGPMDVEDEFGEIEDDHAWTPKSSKTILKKKRMSSPPPPPKEVSSTSETTSDVTSTEVISNEAEPSLASQIPVEAPVSSSEAMVSSSEDTSTSEAAATMLALGQQAGNTEENTYYMVMEEGQLNQLNSSQTYYIDESHLSNGGNVGGYSKMVLAENPEMQPVSAAQPEVAPNVDSTEATL